MGYGWGPGGGGVQGWGGPSGGGGSSTYGEVIPGIHMTYNTTRNSTGIGVGQFRTDNNTMGSVTTLYVYQQDADGNDQGPLLATLSAGGIIYTKGSFGDIMTWKVTAAVDSGTFYTLTATYIAGGEHAAGDIWVTYAPVEVTGVKKYTFTINGNDEAAPPTVLVKENGLGGTVVWTYGGSPGLYYGTLVGAFPNSRTFFRVTQLSKLNDGANQILASVFSEDVISIAGYASGVEDDYVVGGELWELIVFPA